MALKSTICGILHHASQTRDLDSSFKLLLGQSACPRFVPELLYMERKI